MATDLLEHDYDQDADEAHNPSLSSQEMVDAANKSTAGGGIPYKSSGDLAKKEAGATEPSTPTIGDNEPGGIKYSGGAQGQNSKGKSNKKKYGLIAGAVGGVMAVIAMFLSFILPYKLEFILQGIDEQVNAVSDYAVGSRVDALVGRYMTQKYFAAGGGRYAVAGTLEGTLYNNWRIARFEDRLYKSSGIQFEAGSVDKETGLFTRYEGRGNQPTAWRVLSGSHSSAIINGNKFDLHTIFSSNTVDSREFRRIVKQALKDETRFFQVVKRFNLWRIIRNKHQVPGRLVPHIVTDTRASYREKKIAIKKWLVKRAITPFSSKLGLFMGCLIDTATCSGLSRQIQAPTPQEIDDALKTLNDFVDDPEKISKEVLEASAEKFTKNGLANVGNNAVETVVKTVDGVSVSAFSQEFPKLASVLASETTAKLIKTAGVIGLVDILAKIDAALKSNAFGKAAYAMQSLSMINAAYPYMTAASQMKAGDISAEEAGLIMESFDNFEQSPMYQVENGFMKDTSLTAWLTPRASATSETKIPYDCNSDGVLDPDVDSSVDFVTYGNPVCSHMMLAKDYDFMRDQGWYTNTIRPILSAYSASIGKIVGAVLGVFNALIGPVVNALLSATGADKLLASTLEYAASKIISPACTNLEEGGQAYDCLRGGMELMGNVIGEESQNGIGGHYLSPTEYNKVVAYQMDQYEQEWKKQPLYARIFSTKSHRSLLAKAVIHAPSNTGKAVSNIAKVIISPFKAVASVFGSLLSPAKATSDLPADWNPYRIVHYGYALGDSALNQEPGAKPFENCEGTGFKDQDEDRENSLRETEGAPFEVYTTANYCALEKTAIEAAGMLVTPTSSTGI